MDFGGFQDAVQVRSLCAAVAEGYDCVRHGTVCSCRLNRRANLTAFGGSRVCVFGADSVFAYVPRETSRRVVASGGCCDEPVRGAGHVRHVPGEIVGGQRRDAVPDGDRDPSERVVRVVRDDAACVALPFGPAARPGALDERTVRGLAPQLVTRRVALKVRPGKKLSARIGDNIRLLAENVAAQVLDRADDRGLERDAVRR